MWWLYSILTLLSSASVFLVNSPLSVIATLFSTIVLSSKSISPQSSSPLNLCFGFYSLARSPFSLLAGSFLNTGRLSEKKGSPKPVVIISGICTSVLVALLFLVLYRNSNPLFNQYVAGFTFDEINLRLPLFIAFALVFVNGLIYTKTIKKASELDVEFSRDIEATKTQTDNLSFDAVVGISLFALLNIFLLAVNVLDINHLYVIKQLPAGITLSQFVHDGVAALVFSIAVAVLLIAWLLRGDLNFNRYSKILSYLIYGWLIQNALVIINTMIRNLWYIEEYQLTNLRIFVFIFLILSLTALCLTQIKITYKKSAWWLVSATFNSCLIVLVATSVINWDKRVTEYNITHAGANKPLDVDYLTSELSDANLPELVKLLNGKKLPQIQRKEIYTKLLYSYRTHLDTDWQCYNLRTAATRQAMLDLQMK